MAYDGDESLRRNRSRSWWKQRTKMEKNGLVLLIIAVLIIIGLVIGICVVSNKNQDAPVDKVEKEEPLLCLTPDCLKTANDILQNMDDSVNPCDDFYEFACGRFIKTAQIAEDKSSIDNFVLLDDAVKSQLRNAIEKPLEPSAPRPFALVKQLYNVCMNTTAIEADGLRTIKRILRNVGGWPVIEGANWNENFFDWKTSTYKFRQQGLTTDSFIRIQLMPSSENSSVKILTIDQPELDVATENLVGGLRDELIKAYYDYMIDLAVLFGAERDFARYDVKNMLDFKIELAKILVPDEERRNIDATTNLMTISQLQNSYQKIPWLELINNIINRPDKNVFHSDIINVASPDYIRQLPDLLQKTPKRDQSNYAFFQLIRSLEAFLPNNIRNRELQFRAVYAGTTVHRPRWAECVDQVSSLLPLAIGALYVRNYFDEESKTTVNEMVNDLKQEFIKIVDKLDWMDEDTRVTAIEKASSMTSKIGYPVEFLEDKILEEYYARLNLSNNYLDARNQIELFQSDMVLSAFRDPIDKSDWRTSFSTTDINAAYAGQENSINLPAGILQGVFYNKNRPRYINYGSMGYIIGHEITHGFDDQGKKFDINGDLKNWWPKQTNAAFAEKAKCFVKQYSNYLVPEVNLHLNGELTQGENIADNGGIKEAYLAYDSWVKRNAPEPLLPGLNYTAKQLFWLATANVWCGKERKDILANDVLSESHAPVRYRVNVPFGNTKYFAEDFNCPPDSKMIPKHKCEIW